jgi:hypothetical protein
MLPDVTPAAAARPFVDVLQERLLPELLPILAAAVVDVHAAGTSL